MMHRPIAIFLLAILVSGCASNEQVRYYSMYQVGGATAELDSSSAEKAHAGVINSGVFAAASKDFDSPLKLLDAPQQAMPRADIEAGVVGAVIVRIAFNEAGLVDKTQIVSSTKESLSAAVEAAVSRWRIAPALRQGVPARVTVQQSFRFRTEQ